MRTRQQLSLSAAIPGNVPPQAVLAAVQTYTPLIRHHKSMIKFEEEPPTTDTISDDPFFGPYDGSVRRFRIHEAVAMAPGLTKQIQYTSTFQLSPDGLRSRANAPAGIIVWAAFTVRPRPSPTSPSGSESTATTATGEFEDYELHEAITMEANSLLMPFITDSMINVHRQICERVVEEVTRNYLNARNPRRD